MTQVQEMMWLDDHMSDAPSRYLESWAYRLTGPVSQAGIGYAFSQISARHDVMRTQFALLDDRLVQIVSPPGAGAPPAVQHCAATELDSVLRELVSRPMDLNRTAALVTVLIVPPRDTVIVAQLHHILLDDWALHLLEREFEEYYRAYIEQREPALPEVPLQPGPHALAERAAPPDLAAREYWLHRLHDLPRAIPLGDRAAERPRRRSDQAERIVFRLGDSVVSQIRIACRSLRVTPFTLFTAVGALLLQVDRENPDVLIGCPVSRRGSAEHDLMIAPLTSLIPLRVRLQADEPFARLVSEMKSGLHEALAHLNVSYADLNRMTRGARQSARTPLCPLAIVVDDGGETGIEIPGVTAQRIFVPSGKSKFDLYFYFLAERSSYFAYLDYSTDSFSRQRATRLTEEFSTLIGLATADPDCLISQLIQDARRY